MIGTILLTKDNKYVKADGNLPSRPSFDKELLTALCTGALVSKEGYEMLPPSIRKVIQNVCLHYDTPITIKELGKAEVLIVVRSLELVDSTAKEFRLNKHSLIVKQKDIEIWRLKHEV
jgi:hypothetical protein